ncbi:Neutral amino acid transporter A [Mactra antiquata]
MAVDLKTRGRTCKEKCWTLVRQNMLVTLTLIGVAVGFIVGLSVKNPTASAIMWIGMPGELYIRMLKMMILPLVICGVISGTAKMDPRTNGKVSGISLSFIMIANFIPCIVAAILTLIIKPGEGVVSDVADKFSGDVMETEDIFADLFRNIVPDNIIASCIQQAQTKYEFTTKDVVTFNGTINITETVREMTRKYVGAANSTNILGLIIVCSIFGVAAASMTQKQGEPFLAFFRSATDIIIKILRVLIWSTPVGVASLIAKTIVSTDDIEDTFRKLGFYFLTVMTGLVIHMFIVMPIVFFLIRRRNPFRFMATTIPSIMIVFATGSTMIALPESFHALEEKNNVDTRISRFVAPLAATIGRSGSAMYITTSCIFIIQTLGRDVNAADIILVILLTWISALAIPSVTGASLVTVLILLTALSIPGEAAAMLFALEFFLDRSRSVVNLNSQLIGVVVTDRYCGEMLPKDDQESKLKHDEIAGRNEGEVHLLQGVPNENNTQCELHANDVQCLPNDNEKDITQYIDSNSEERL